MVDRCRTIAFKLRDGIPALWDTLTLYIRSIMVDRFEVGDNVSWNSEAGRVTGAIVRVYTGNFQVHGYTRHASAEPPQYEIKSSKTEHIAFHKGSALTKLRD